jgi:integrase
VTTRHKIAGVKRFWSEKARKTYYYHRLSGTRIHSEYGTAAFVAEVDRLNQAWKAKTAARNTLDHLIQEYRKTPEFQRLKPITKADYERVLIMFEKAGGMPLSSITRAQVFQWRNQAFAKHKRRFANYVVQVLSRMLGVGVNLGLLETNPALRVEKIRKATGEKHRNRPWTVGERDAVIAAAPIQLKAPLAFMRYLGARLGDVRTMPAAAYQEGMIIFRTGKGDVEVCVPCPAPLAAILDQRLPSRTHLFVTSEGTPWTDGGWNASWRKLRTRLEEAGQVRPGLTAHGLRHSVATDLRELGKTDREIADILGQRTTYATPIYHRTADMKRSNARVMSELHGHDRSEEKSNPVSNLPG